MIRAEVDSSDATTGNKIRTGIRRKVPVLLVVGTRSSRPAR